MANFFLANLYKADLSEAYMGSTNFTGADLRKANFTGAEFDESTKFESTQQKGLIFCKTKTPWGVDNSGC